MEMSDFTGLIFRYPSLIYVFSFTESAMAFKNSSNRKNYRTLNRIGMRTAVEMLLLLNLYIISPTYYNMVRSIVLNNIAGE